jgi:hypothetical protein
LFQSTQCLTDLLPVLDLDTNTHSSASYTADAVPVE